MLLFNECDNLDKIKKGDKDQTLKDWASGLV